MLKKFLPLLLPTFVAGFLFFSFVPVSLAEGLLPDTQTGGGQCPEGYKGGNCGNYSLNDMLSVAIKVSDWILGIIGSVTLLFLIYGGFTFILSGGSSEKIQKGKSLLLNSIIGLVIVFTSYLIIQFAMTALGVPGADRGLWSTFKGVSK